VRVSDASTFAELNVLNGHTDSVKSVAFSRDSMRIVSGSDDMAVTVWDVLTGTELNLLKGHTRWVCSVAFSRERIQIVSGSRDESLRVLDVSTCAELKGHNDGIQVTDNFLAPDTDKLDHLFPRARPSCGCQKRHK
jgi:WD40 repeat protein